MTSLCQRGWRHLTQQAAELRFRRAALPAFLVVIGLVSLPFVDQTFVVDRPADIVAGVLIAAAGAVTGLRRRWPLPTLIAATVLTASYLSIGYPYGPILLSPAVSVYAVARLRNTANAAAWSTSAAAVLSLPHLTNDASLPGLIGVIAGAAWVAVPFTLGVARRMVAEAQARERAETERRIIDAERLRLAHEVHDVVGHGLAAIHMQADIALHLRHTKPAQAFDALAAICAASAESLAELRAALATITPNYSEIDSRRGPTPGPTPGLARVPQLCDRLRASGLTVDLTITGARQPLPGAADVTAYRVVQEALTNVVKHSPHPRAEVLINHTSYAVELLISNQALDTDHVDGLGITGMRRRVENVGGTLTVGRRASSIGTFSLHATIPRPEQEAR